MRLFQVHGGSTNLISESTPLALHTKPVELTSWRPDLEHQILEARNVLDIAIVRPALLYGGDGSLLKMWLEPVRQAAAAKGVASIVGDPSSPVTLVHKDDLADLYVRLVEQVRAPPTSHFPLPPHTSATDHVTYLSQFTIVAASTYPVIDGASHQEQLGDIVTAFAKVVKFEGQVTYKAASNAFEEAMLTRLNYRSNKARGVLGWVPKQIPFVQGAELYAEAYNAWN